MGKIRFLLIAAVLCQLIPPFRISQNRLFDSSLDYIVYVMIVLPVGLQLRYALTPCLIVRVIRLDVRLPYLISSCACRETKIICSGNKND